MCGSYKIKIISFKNVELKYSSCSITVTFGIIYNTHIVCVCVCTCAACGSFLDKVSQLTVADEGALGVLAVAVEADVWVQVALVHIWPDEDTLELSVADPREGPDVNPERQAQSLASGRGGQGQT